MLCYCWLRLHHPTDHAGLCRRRGADKGEEAAGGETGRAGEEEQGEDGK